MRVRSEWLTLFTVTALAAGALFLRGGSSDPAPAKRPNNAAATGIDFTPIGAIHPLTEGHALPRLPKPRKGGAARP